MRHQKCHDTKTRRQCWAFENFLVHAVGHASSRKRRKKKVPLLYLPQSSSGPACEAAGSAQQPYRRCGRNARRMQIGGRALVAAADSGGTGARVGLRACVAPRLKASSSSRVGESQPVIRGAEGYARRCGTAAPAETRSGNRLIKPTILCFLRFLFLLLFIELLVFREENPKETKLSKNYKASLLLGHLNQQSRKEHLAIAATCCAIHARQPMSGRPLDIGAFPIFHGDLTCRPSSKGGVH